MLVARAESPGKRLTKLIERFAFYLASLNSRLLSKVTREELCLVADAMQPSGYARLQPAPTTASY